MARLRAGSLLRAFLTAAKWASKACSIAAEPGGPAMPNADPPPSEASRMKLGEPSMSKFGFRPVVAPSSSLRDAT